MKAYEPTPADRAMVSSLSKTGVPQTVIGKRIGIGPKTLRRYFREELDKGNAEACSKVATTLYERGIDGDNACLIFWAKTQMGWSEHKPSAAELVLLQTVRSLRLNPADLAEVLRLSGMNDEQRDANRELTARLKQLKEGQP